MVAKETAVAIPDPNEPGGYPYRGSAQVVRTARGWTVRLEIPFFSEGPHDGKAGAESLLADLNAYRAGWL